MCMCFLAQASQPPPDFPRNRTSRELRDKDKDDVDLMLIDSFLAGLSDGEH